jgi:hypothetical protein
MSTCCAVLVVLAILLLAAGLWLRRAGQQAGAALAGWGAVRSATCDAPATITPACDQLLADPGVPPVMSGDTFGAPNSVFDRATAAYATQVVARFVAYIGTGDSAYAGLTGMQAPAFTSIALDAMPLAATWVSPDGATAVVAIRGTRTVKDLMADLRYGQTVTEQNHQMTLNVPIPDMLGAPAGDVAVHSGMYAVYLAAKPGLLAALPATVRTVFVAGHSMGAALAFYYALDLAQRHVVLGFASVAPQNEVAVTVRGIAPPRAGNAAFASMVAIAADAASLINTADLVPSLPWSYMPNSADPTAPLEYAHVQPVAAFTNRQPDIGSCHAPPAYFAGLASAVVVPSV